MVVPDRHWPSERGAVLAEMVANPHIRQKVMEGPESKWVSFQAKAQKRFCSACLKLLSQADADVFIFMNALDRQRTQRWREGRARQPYSRSYRQRCCYGTPWIENSESTFDLKRTNFCMWNQNYYRCRYYWAYWSMRQSRCLNPGFLNGKVIIYLVLAFVCGN